MTGQEMDPDLAARLWQFIQDVREGTAADCPDAWLFASFLVGLCENLMVELLVRAHGQTVDDAKAAVGELLEAQCRLYGSLAATPADDIELSWLLPPRTPRPGA